MNVAAYLLGPYEDKGQEGLSTARFKSFTMLSTLNACGVHWSAGIAHARAAAGGRT
jgi:hypothetical protein